ncbi:hypothetical protein E3P99_03812 [Wallemia hederae]|uniref:Uncharacterized protein n=1 Tax=Wallemia hederae TaxID=1540922 RepID=A0A4T0FD10_9BASI|nr:hypothetical protein E3P99_03812 [Wallemia hederae]
MIRGIGVDLLCLSRLHKLIGRRRAGVERLGKRILTPAELSALPVHSVDAQLRYLGVVCQRGGVQGTLSALPVPLAGSGGGEAQQQASD